MGNKKVKRWRSRPSGGKKDNHVSYPRPTHSGVYRIQRKPEEKAHVGSEQQSSDERKQPPAVTKAPRKKPKKKRKYKSIPVTKSKEYARAPYSEREKLKAERARQRRRNNVFLRAMVACVFLVVAVVICIFVFFKIGSIEVTGSEKYKAAQIIEAAGVEPGDNLFAPTAAGIQKKLDTTLPYIKSVTLKHRLPDTLIICVKEGEAQYAFKGEGKEKANYILTDSELKFLEKTDKPPRGAAVVEGAAIKNAAPGEKAVFESAEKGELVQTIRKTFADNKLDNITLINVNNIINITAIYNHTLTVEIGQATALDYKCKMAAKAIEDALSENKKAKGVINVKQADQTKQAYYDPK